MANHSLGLGLVQIADRSYGYMQKDEGLGWSNAGLIAGKNTRATAARLTSTKAAVIASICP